VDQPSQPSAHKRSALRTLFAACAVAAVLAACGGSSSSSSSASSSASSAASTAASTTSKGATLQLWLGGILTTSTPGTPYLKWVDEQIARFKAAEPGSNVQITLLPADNDQLAAKVESAFAADKVPDVMMLYSGAYTTAYTNGLLPLNKYVNATSGFYGSMSNWDLSCTDFNCQGGSGTILGVPTDDGGFFLFYNKALLAKAGITGAPSTFSQLLSDCSALKGKGIVPLTYGDRDGYTTVNWLDEDIGSYLTSADGQSMLAGKLKLTDPRIVQALQQIAQLRSNGCVQADATTHEQIDATNAFAAGKTAMVEMYPSLFTNFQKTLGSKLGVSTLPISGNGPLASEIAANSLDNWVIPKHAAHPDLGWEWIKLVSDEQAGEGIATLLGNPPANIAADAAIANPLLKYMAAKVKQPGVPLLDSVLPNSVALYLYKELQQAFAGKVSAQAAMSATQTAFERQSP
jgi:ABC-type glycerol-3-phosphate transport system substrate-binding protein